jgi:hypothetical protein
MRFRSSLQHIIAALTLQTFYSTTETLNFRTGMIQDRNTCEEEWRRRKRSDLID